MNCDKQQMKRVSEGKMMWMTCIKCNDDLKAECSRLKEKFIYDRKGMKKIEENW